MPHRSNRRSRHRPLAGGYPDCHRTFTGSSPAQGQGTRLGDEHARHAGRTWSEPRDRGAGLRRDRCRRCARHQRDLPRERAAGRGARSGAGPPRAVVFTGWSSNGGPSEAEQMYTAWRGQRPTSRYLLKPAPQSTPPRTPCARCWSSRAWRALQDVSVVCSVRHALRVRFFFDALYPAPWLPGRLPLRAAGRRPPRPAVAAELSSITRMVRDRRAALGLLAGEVVEGSLSPAGP